MNHKLIPLAHILLFFSKPAFAWSPLHNHGNTAVDIKRASSEATTSSMASSSVDLFSRRKAIASTIGFGFAATLQSLSSSTTSKANAIDNDGGSYYPYERRDRNGNKDAIVKEDYWYVTGSAPPRRFDPSLVLDDPKWNAFGSCATTEGTGGSNSCTYVSLKQRQPAYSKYAPIIALGGKDYSSLGKTLRKIASDMSISDDSAVDSDWIKAGSYVQVYEKQLPPPAVDSLLKMALFGSAMFVSPNFNGPSRDFLVVKFYVNETNFAMKELRAAIKARNIERALAAWEFGKDSWNSYFSLVNKQISPKVGDKFEVIG